MAAMIQKGNIVQYKNGWYRVSAVYKDGTANLKGVFNNHLYHKRVPMAAMVEDGNGFWAWYQNSDAYRQN
jgi:hypothetical protein